MLHTHEVTGSSPVVSTIKIRWQLSADFFVRSETNLPSQPFDKWRLCQELCSNYLAGSGMREVSQRWMPPQRPPPGASYSCLSCCPTGCQLHATDWHRPAWGRGYRSGKLPPHGCGSGSPGSASRDNCWYGSSSSARRESRNMLKFPSRHILPCLPLHAISLREVLRQRLWLSLEPLFCSLGHGFQHFSHKLYLGFGHSGENIAAEMYRAGRYLA